MSKCQRPARCSNCSPVAASLNRIAAPTAAIVSVAEVIAAIEGPIAMTECSVEAGLCNQEENCDLRGNWQRISLAVAGALQEVSLAEMAAPAARISDPLRITTLNAG